MATRKDTLSRMDLDRRAYDLTYTQAKAAAARRDVIARLRTANRWALLNTALTWGVIGFAVLYFGTAVVRALVRGALPAPW